MGRRLKSLTEAQKAEVETLAALLSQDQIADYLGLCRNTFKAICERDPEVNARYKRGKAKAIAHVAQGLLMKARNGDTTSSIFYLKTQAGWRETAAIAHSVDTDLGDETDEALLARLNALLDGLHLTHGLTRPMLPGPMGSAR